MTDNSPEKKDEGRWTTDGRRQPEEDARRRKTVQTRREKDVGEDKQFYGVAGISRGLLLRRDGF
jgi:hypothetical protein